MYSAHRNNKKQMQLCDDLRVLFRPAGRVRRSPPRIVQPRRPCAMISAHYSAPPDNPFIRAAASAARGYPNVFGPSQQQKQMQVCDDLQILFNPAGRVQ